MKRCSRRSRAAVLAALVVLASSATAGGEVPVCVPAGVGADSFCEVRGVKLHYVDWGGTGPTIILLSGLGNSARIFDELAPMVAGDYRVLAFTRRGYGLSDHTVTNYSNAALVGDIVGLMDSLSITSASIVGHSIAGGEMATLAAEHPKRVERLVYLDAAYDRSRALDLMANLPPMPQPSAEDRASLEALTAWRESALGTQSVAVGNDLRQVTVPGAEGLAPKTPAAVNLEVIEGDVAAPPRYAEIEAPSLAIYSSKDVLEQVPPETPPQRRTAILDYFIHAIRPWMLRAQAEFLEEQECGVAVEVPRSTHYIFLERPVWTAATIRSFLDSPAPCRWSPSDKLVVPK